jgi:hypothetical protein
MEISWKTSAWGASGPNTLSNANGYLGPAEREFKVRRREREKRKKGGNKAQLVTMLDLFSAGEIRRGRVNPPKVHQQRGDPSRWKRLGTGEAPLQTRATLQNESFRHHDRWIGKRPTSIEQKSVPKGRTENTRMSAKSRKGHSLNGQQTGLNQNAELMRKLRHRGD